MTMKSGDDHGGNLRKLSMDSGIDANDILDFSSNVNPIGFPEWVRPLISSQVSDISKYPDPDCEELIHAVSHTVWRRSGKCYCRQRLHRDPVRHTTHQELW